MYNNDDGMESSSKMQTLMDLISKMKELQADGANPKKAMAIDIHAEKLPTDEESMSEEGDEESPEHESLESPEEEASEHDEDEDQHTEMQLPEGLMKLIMEKLHK